MAGRQRGPYYMNEFDLATSTNDSVDQQEQEVGRETMRQKRAAGGSTGRTRNTSSDEDVMLHGGEELHPRRWSKEEDLRLRNAVEKHHEANWKDIAAEVASRNHVQCLQRWKKVLTPGLVKGQWSREEDKLLMSLVNEGHKNWGTLSSRVPGRTSKQCRERWCHHLDPKIVKGDWTREEDDTILSMHAEIGNKWAAIAQKLNGRTENATKIRWKILERNKKQDEDGNTADHFPKANTGRQGADERLRCLAAQAAAAAMSKANESTNAIGIPENPAAVKRLLAEKKMGMLFPSAKVPSLPAAKRQSLSLTSSVATGLKNGNNKRAKEEPEETKGRRGNKRRKSTATDGGRAAVGTGGIDLSLSATDVGGGETTKDTGGSVEEGMQCGRRGWLQEEDQRLRQAVARLGERNWRYVAPIVGTRTHVQCQQRWKKALRPGLVKGAWSVEEDENLVTLIGLGFSTWSELASHTPGRTAKQCRERWCHHLDPSVNHGNWSQEEDRQLKTLQARLGTKWSAIAREMPGRTEHAVKGRVKTLTRCQRQASGSGVDHGEGARKVTSRQQKRKVNDKADADVTVGSRGTVDCPPSVPVPSEVTAPTSESPTVSPSLSPSPSPPPPCERARSADEDNQVNVSTTTTDNTKSEDTSDPFFPDASLQPPVVSLVCDYDPSACLSGEYDALRQAHQNLQLRELQQQEYQQSMQRYAHRFSPQQHASTQQEAMLRQQQQQQQRQQCMRFMQQSKDTGVSQSVESGNTNGHLDQMSIAKLLSLSSTESEQLSDTFSSVASGCCGGAVAAMAAANNQSKEAIDRQLCAALAAEGSASRDYQREQGAGQQQQHHQRHQQQSEERPVSPSLRPPAAMSNRTGTSRFPVFGRRESKSAAPLPTPIATTDAEALLLNPQSVAQSVAKQQGLCVPGLGSGLGEDTPRAEWFSGTEADASLMCNTPNDVDYSDLASFLKDSFDANQDGVGIGTERVSLGGDPYSDYSEFGGYNTLDLAQYPLGACINVSRGLAKPYWAQSQLDIPIQVYGENTHDPSTCSHRGSGDNAVSELGSDFCADIACDPYF